VSAHPICSASSPLRVLTVTTAPLPIPLALWRTTRLLPPTPKLLYPVVAPALAAAAAAEAEAAAALAQALARAVPMATLAEAHNRVAAPLPSASPASWVCLVSWLPSRSHSLSALQEDAFLLVIVHRLSGGKGSMAGQSQFRAT
jgi:hypothetical protein